MLRLTAMLSSLVLILAGCGTYVPEFTLEVAPASTNAAAYSTQTFKVIQRVYGGSDIDVTASAAVTLSDTSIATLTSTPGQYRTSGYGGAFTINASYSGKSASAKVTAAAAQAISVWGDSLTAGTGASSTATTFPSQLSRPLARSVENYGVGGQSSQSIAARQGGVPALLTLEGNVVQPGSNKVLSYSISPSGAQGPGPLQGSIAGVPGTLIDTVSVDPPQLAFTPTNLSAAIQLSGAAPFIPATDPQRDQIQVLWMGRNNAGDVAQVISDLKACAAFVRSGRVIVLSVLNAQGEGTGTDIYSAIVSLNQQIAGLSGVQYIDVRALLVAAYDSSSAQDVADHQADIPPTSLRADNIHLRDSGYAIVAKAVADRINALGW